MKNTYQCQWHTLEASGLTVAMNTPTGVLVATSKTGTMAHIEDVHVAKRWHFDGTEWSVEIGLALRHAIADLDLIEGAVDRVRRSHMPFLDPSRHDSFDALMAALDRETTRWVPIDGDLPPIPDELRGTPCS